MCPFQCVPVFYGFFVSHTDMLSLGQQTSHKQCNLNPIKTGECLSLEVSPRFIFRVLKLGTQLKLGKFTISNIELDITDYDVSMLSY